MKRLILISLVSVTLGQSFAQEKTPDAISVVSHLQEKHESDMNTLIRKTDKINQRIDSLQKDNKSLGAVIDSLTLECQRLQAVQASDRAAFSDSIQTTNKSVEQSYATLNNRSVWAASAVGMLLLTFGIVCLLLHRRINKGTTSIAEVRKAQKTLREAQTKMQEESIKLDNQLLAVASQQIAAATQKPNGNDAEPDHSLAKKVADEIVRIELNLSRMDSSIKGHKQLAKAVQRIKDNFNANGYEIVDMLGKPYNEGMRINADFAIDESLEPGTRIITSITKPQIMYNGQLIQKATVTVTQNI